MQRKGIAGAAGCCQKCPRKTDVHVVGVGSLCARHYIQHVKREKIPITPKLLAHYKKIAGAKL